jgi:hypothetical protein
MKLAYHPLNLALRFILELSALAAMGLWGWNLSGSWIRIIPAAGIPVLASVIWGTFTVPNDPSRSGRSPVPVSGWLRLVIETIILGFGTWVLFDLGYALTGWILGTLILIHYLFSFDRIQWLLKGKDIDERTHK